MHLSLGDLHPVTPGSQQRSHTGQSEDTRGCGDVQSSLLSDSPSTNM